MTFCLLPPVGPEGFTHIIHYYSLEFTVHIMERMIKAGCISNCMARGNFCTTVTVQPLFFLTLNTRGKQQQLGEHCVGLCSEVVEGFRASMLRLSIALLILQLVSALPQIHYFGNAIAPLRSQKQDQPSISPEAVTVTLASLLSIKAPISVDAHVSRQVCDDA